MKIPFTRQSILAGRTSFTSAPPAPTPEVQQSAGGTVDSMKSRQATAHLMLRKMIRRKGKGDQTAEGQTMVEVPRRYARVASVAPGVVHVQLQGGADFFESIGMPDIATGDGQKRVEYLAIRNDGYRMHLAGGKKIYQPASMTGDEFLQILEPSRWRTPSVVAYCNGGFYNSSYLGAPDLSLDEQFRYPEHASIGTSRLKAGRTIPSIPPQARYADDYHTLKFRDGSCVSSAPLLTSNSDGTHHCIFTKEKLRDSKYRAGPGTERPGQLGHANDPHPRTAISVPMDYGVKTSSGKATPKTNCIRMAIAVTDTSPAVNLQGFKMDEWASVMHRLGTFNAQPGLALNLDGGASSVLGVLNAQGDKLIEIRGARHHSPTTTTFVCASRKTYWF